MDASALRLFRAVAETGSLATAAERVHSVPSNLSARIRKLEEELGAELFLREPRGMRLTPSGELLRDYADRILALTDEARLAVRESVGEGGVLRIASLETVAAVRLPPLLASFHKVHPKVQLTLSTGTSEANLRTVLDRKADLAFVGGTVSHDRIVGRAVFVEELVLVAPAGVTDAAEVTSRAILSFRHGCAYRARTEAWLRERGESPGVIMEFGTLDGLLGCIAAGLGVTLLPRAVVERSHLDGQFAVFPIPDGRVETWLIRHRDTVPTLAMRAFEREVDGSPLPQAGEGGAHRAAMGG